MSYLGFQAKREHSLLPRTASMQTNGIKTASIGSSNPLAGGQVAYGSPKFYSPIHTPTTWQIPTKRREVNLWCRFFASNEPRVASALDIYSQLPITEFENICEDEAVTAYYDNIVRKLKLNDLLNKIAYEYFCIGDVFIFANVACDKCQGSGVTPGSERKDGSYIPCAHEGGTFHSLILLNPDWIEVSSSSITNEEILFLVPGNDVKNIVQRQSPPELYNRIPDFVKQAVMLGKPIQLHPMCATHLAHNPSGSSPYGRSLISRLFRTLAYKDKILQAQWIAADRHILPVRIVKVGSPEMPATEQDIISMQQQLLVVNQDPTVTLVTHHATEYDFVGASGKVMQLGKEYDMIDQEILDGLMINKALLNGEGPTYSCHNADSTEFMTISGWKKYSDILVDDLLATFNNENGNLEYQNYINRFEYDFDGELVHFISSKLDCQVTENHNMLVLPRNDKDRSKALDKWKVVKAGDIKPRSTFRGCVEGFQGSIPANLDIPKELTLEEYIELACFYITEGWLGDYKKRKSYEVFISQNRSINIDNCNKIEYLVSKFSNHGSSEKDGENFTYRITSKELQDNFRKNFGELAPNKKLPVWFKNLPVEYLKIMLPIFAATDGNTRKANKKNKDCKKKYYTAITSSNQLADDIQEIALKCGFAPKKIKIDAKGWNGHFNKTGHKYINHLDMYRVYWSDGKFEKYPSIEKTKKYPNKIQKLPYKGKVVCFEVPNHFLITRVNGKIIITGNSAAVGLEAFIKRLDNFRGILKRFIEENVYLPIAKMQGFTTKNERNEEEPLYPKVRFKEMRLRDDTQQKNILLQMADKKYISRQTLLEYFNIDFNIEINRLRMENILQSEYNLGDEEEGGIGGGMPDLGGGGGPMPDMGGGDSPDMSGGMPDMGGGAGGPEASMPNPYRSPIVSRKVKKITKQKHYTKQELEAMKPKKLVLNVPEQKVFRVLENMQKNGELRQPFVPQYRPFKERKFILDFAFPKLKLGIEVDGPLHDTPDKINEDTEKDMYFQKMGWKLCRFKEEDINKHLDDIVIPNLKNIIMERIKEFSPPVK